VSGHGATVSEAFAQVALGVFALAVDPASVEERDTREVRAHGGAPETLLVNWLNECLYVLDVEGFVALRVEFAVFELDVMVSGGEPLRLHCRLLGEDADPARHVPRQPVRDVSAEGAAVVKLPNGAEARVVVLIRGNPGA
jgi:SHS2 domain-containing protein